MVLIFLRPIFSRVVFASKNLAFLDVVLAGMYSAIDVFAVISKNNCPKVEKESFVIPGTAKNSSVVFGKAFDNAKSTLSLNTELGGMELA